MSRIIICIRNIRIDNITISVRDIGIGSTGTGGKAATTIEARIAANYGGTVGVRTQTWLLEGDGLQWKGLGTPKAGDGVSWVPKAWCLFVLQKHARKLTGVAVFCCIPRYQGQLWPHYVLGPLQQFRGTVVEVDSSEPSSGELSGVPYSERATAAHLGLPPSPLKK